MQEAFLHFIWENQYFSKNHLHSTSGAKIQVLDPGKLNSEDGPDFLQARIKIESVVWVGAVEIHTRSSHWFKHRHQHDPAYQQVILHVVWEDDQPVFSTGGGKRLPTLTLAGLVPQKYSSRFLSWDKLHKIPCHPLIRLDHQPIWESMLDHHLLARFKSKLAVVVDYHQSTVGDWDATAYHVINTCFGFKKNSWGFSQLSKQVPLEIVRRVSNHPHQLEALFFGQSGLLPSVCEDTYSQSLLQEYQYLKRKYKNLPPALPISSWKFLRTRPRSFPTLRLAQLAALQGKRAFRFAEYRGANWLSRLSSLLEISLPKYWQSHYHFGRTTNRHRLNAKLSNNVYNHLLINAIIPLRLTYLDSIGQQADFKSTLQLLRKLPCEQNALVNHWKKTGFTINSAYQSQALLDLDQMRCAPKKCLQCPLGVTLIRQG